MTLPEITDIVQFINLIGFTACLVYALYIARRWRWTRLWLLPLVTYILNSALFYAATVFNVSSVPVRTMWSASLRLHAIVLILIGLAALCWMLRERDKEQ